MKIIEKNKTLCGIYTFAIGLMVFFKITVICSLSLQNSSNLKVI